MTSSRVTRHLQTAAAAALIAALGPSAHAAQSNTPQLPSTPQTSTQPATPQVPSNGARYNQMETPSSSGSAQSPSKDTTATPNPNAALAPLNSPTLGPQSLGNDPLGREIDPGPASRGKAYNVRPINPY